MADQWNDLVYKTVWIPSDPNYFQILPNTAKSKLSLEHCQSISLGSPPCQTSMTPKHLHIVLSGFSLSLCKWLSNAAQSQDKKRKSHVTCTPPPNRGKQLTEKQAMMRWILNLKYLLGIWWVPYKKKRPTNQLFLQYEQKTLSKLSHGRSSWSPPLMKLHLLLSGRRDFAQKWTKYRASHKACILNSSELKQQRRSRTAFSQISTWLFSICQNKH